MHIQIHTQGLFKKYQDRSFIYQEKNEEQMKLFCPIIISTFLYTFLIQNLTFNMEAEVELWNVCRKSIETEAVFYIFH